MKIKLGSGEVCLSDNQPVSLRQARGLCVTCTAGLVWITVTGEAGDTFLKPGQSHQIESNGLAIIESIGSGKIRLNKPDGVSALLRHLGETLRKIGFCQNTGVTESARLS